MLDNQTIKIADIYVPVKLRKTVDSDKVEAAALALMEDTPRHPIKVRPGKGRYVLVDGLHRLEAARALGEDDIVALVVSARKY